MDTISGIAMVVITDKSLEEKFFVFEDRLDAGKKLAEFLKKHLEDLKNHVVLAIPRGGVPVGAVISKELKAPLGLIIVRKLPIPWDPEAGFGAVTSYGEPVINKNYLEYLGISEEEFREIVDRVKREIKRREEIYSKFTKSIDVKGKILILVDDGLATGYTMLAAIKSVKGSARRVIVAVPTASREAVNRVSREADEVYCLNVRTGIPYFAVAEAYKKWRDLTDRDVINVLKELNP